jgi:hypothetical protein
VKRVKKVNLLQTIFLAQIKKENPTEVSLLLLEMKIQKL